MYVSEDMVRDGCDCVSFWAISCPFKKVKKTPGDIIILQKWTKNHNHMLYCSLDMAHNRCNCYFSFWAIFCPFAPLTARKMKRIPGDIIILQQCTKNHDHMLYCSWDMARDGCNYFSFWAIFCPFTLFALTAWKMKN